jgi:hypothetical protein
MRFFVFFFLCFPPFTSWEGVYLKLPERFVLDYFEKVVSNPFRRGKFKCPIYSGRTDPGISIPEIKELQIVPTAWLFFRIAYPNDDEFGRNRTLNPEYSHQEYIIP